MDNDTTQNFNEKQKTLAQRIEALLFVESGPIPIDGLARMLSVQKKDIEEGLSFLEEQYKSRESAGITLVRSESGIALATAPSVSGLMEEITKKALERDIGPAGLEVLAILLYKGPTARSGIDYIRGVNSASTLRNLFIGGLTERVKNPDDAREFLYKPTADLLAHLGVSRVEDLPEYAERQKALEEFEAQAQEGGEEKGEE